MLNKVTINAIPTYSVKKKDFNFNQIKTRKFDSNTEPVEQSTLNCHHMSNTFDVHKGYQYGDSLSLQTLYI